MYVQDKHVYWVLNYNKKEPGVGTLENSFFSSYFVQHRITQKYSALILLRPSKKAEKKIFIHL